MYNRYANNRSGYLNHDFRVFHLRDKKQQEFEFHYHDFKKIIFFLSGKVTYLIEGKSYILKPGDILLVDNHDIHKPLIDPSETYERIIIWANMHLIEAYRHKDCDIARCFQVAKEKKSNLIRLESSTARDKMKTVLTELETSLTTTEFGSNLLSKALFIQLMIYLNRMQLNHQAYNLDDAITYDKQIEKILNYINEHLAEDISITFLAEKFFLSRYYMMHKFKKATGYSLHNYVLQKRLIVTANLIKQGIPITKAATQCGFHDYSNFLRAFKKLFKKSPREWIS
ncbi:AraC family transcriptional regulator [Anaerosinus massiliensis]|uniref:AraC family transcriptional regulator n=1 Tax=Massilibacillus massiliensis TaxID=1806837 RepID=UPI000DA60157|nr:AraC family transcriptional regulator [Massilibacillus massiliensis]